MTQHAQYKKLDFVDYFKVLTGTKDEWIERLTDRPKCLAALEAFIGGRTILGKALFAFSDELSDLHHSFQEIAFLQAARRHTLPETDSRYIGFGETLQKQYPEFFPERAVKGTAQDFWYVERRPSQLIHRNGETEKGWDEIHWENRARYIEYWKMAWRAEYDTLLSNEDLLARLDAHNRQKPGPDGVPYITELLKFAGSSLESLHPELQLIVLGNLSRYISLGIVELPTDLQSRFPEIYAERGTF